MMLLRSLAGGIRGYHDCPHGFVEGRRPANDMAERLQGTPREPCSVAGGNRSMYATQTDVVANRPTGQEPDHAACGVGEAE